MQNMKERKITEVKYFACGYCTNKLKYIIKKPDVKVKEFYAGVFLINHSKYGYILFDTGYSEQIYKCGLVGKLYNLFNPVYINKNEKITEQLRKEDINCNSIKNVILSHLHPDHIGCVKEFYNSKFIVSQDCMKEYKRSNIKSLVLKKMLPHAFESRTIIIEKFNKEYEVFKGFDLFEDGSIILTQIDGHFKGQMCAYIPEHKIFLGADICWGLKFKDKVDEMHPFARLVQNNFNEYKKGIELVKKLEERKIKVYLSHDDYDKKELI